MIYFISNPVFSLYEFNSMKFLHNHRGRDEHVIMTALIMEGIKSSNYYLAAELMGK